ncbi:unnamed protein product, partial [Allacma fusca]
EIRKIETSYKGV